MKLLLLGANGQLGWELSRSLMPHGRVIAVGRDQCDVANLRELPRYLETIRPDIIVNAAAYTAVDTAETEIELANTINGTAVGLLANAAKKTGALLLHYSTDYIFDGESREPYREDDTPKPINAYGRSKLLGEQAIQAVACDHLIIRTAWVYSKRGKNFVKTILRLAKERQPLRVVDDQIGCPTWTRNLADISNLLLLRAQQQRATRAFVSATINVASRDSISWHGFATAILEEAHRLALIEAIPECRAIGSADYPAPANRPRHSVLSTARLEQEFGLYMPDWRSALRLCLEDWI